MNNTKVHYIPPLPPKREKKVGIYCRVSTNSKEQLKSLSAQVSGLTRIIASMPQWLLVDVYMDIASGKSQSSRPEFVRMVEECKGHKLEIILTKNVSRFGRDTVEVLSSLREIKNEGVRVIFEQESLDTAITDSNLMISIIEAIAQSENESRSENIKWEIKQRVAQGTSKLYNRKCYGYVHNKEGNLIIRDDEAKNVRKIFEMYLHGKSIIGIVTELERLAVKSPTGKDKWSKRTIDMMLSNEKYMGSVRLLDNGKHEAFYLCEDNNPAIISKEKFKVVQIEKTKRSNIVKGENGVQRKSKKYSSKQ